MIRGVIAATKPDEIQVTMSITMVREWRVLREKIADDGHPAWRLRALISHLIAKVEAHFDESAEVEP